MTTIPVERIQEPPLDLIRPRRKITGMSAILLPFFQDGQIDWVGFDQHVERTIRADLVPAVNMDTGYVNLLDTATKIEVLEHTRAITAGKEFVAGAFVKDKKGDLYNAAAHKREIDDILEHGGTPVLMQSHGLTSQSPEEILASYRGLASECDRCIAFELGKMFADFGAIYSLELYKEIIMIPSIIGAKHSSLSRRPEWDRLRIRDAVRPDFKVFTGNDLAIDMVMYGCDYLLGLSTFAPDLFAFRDRLWENGDSAFYELNDVLQYLGFFTFRKPVPGYKHNAAQFLKMQKWITCDLIHPGSIIRPVTDIYILQEILEKLTWWREQL